MQRALASLVVVMALIGSGGQGALAADDGGALPPADGVATVQPVEAGVWKILKDDAGNMPGSVHSVAIDGAGRVVVCCIDARIDGQDVLQAFRIDDPDPVLTLDPDTEVAYPDDIRVDAAGTFWMSGYDGLVSSDSAGTTVHRIPGLRDAYLSGVIGFGADGSVWTGLEGDRPAVARLTDGAWTIVDDAAALPRLTGQWGGQIAAIEGTPDGTVWVAVLGMEADEPGGLLRFDGTTWKQAWPLGKGVQTRTEALAVAPGGDLWAYLLAERKNGRWAPYLARRDGSGWTVYGKGDGVPDPGSYDDFTRVILRAAPDGAVWLTARAEFECARLHRFDGERWSDWMKTACIKDLEVAPDGTAWVSAEWLTNYGAEHYDQGLYVITPGNTDPYPPGATVVSAPDASEGPVAQAAAEYLRDCQLAASSDDEARMCGVVAPFVEAALRTAVDTCGGEEAEGDAAGMCMGLLAPMIAASLVPPPWRETTDVDLAAAYVDLVSRYGAPDDESRAIASLEPEQAQAAWQSVAANSVGLADSIVELAIPEHALVVAMDTIERLRQLGDAALALAGQPDDADLLEAYRTAAVAARASETELRWALGLPPPATAVLESFADGSDEDFEEPPSQVRALVSARSGHAATLLPDGRVALLGGLGAGGNAIADAELFDPVTESFEAAGATPHPLGSPTAVTMPDGRVFVVGGWEHRGRFDVIASLLDPITGTSEPLDGLEGLVSVDVVTQLADGRVVIVGPGPSSAATAAIFDPDSRSIEHDESPVEGREEGSATRLSDDRVLLLGGIGEWLGDSSETAEVFDPTDGGTVTTAPPIHRRSGHTATLLGDGTVLVAGGSEVLAGLASASIFDPTTMSFAAVGSLTRPRSGHTATLLNDGRVLIVGGYRGSDVFDSDATAEIYDPATQRFTLTGSLGVGRVHHTATLLEDGRVLIAGGEGSYETLASAELYDPSSGTFSPVVGNEAPATD